MSEKILIAARDVAADRRRGGEVRVLLSPKSVGSTSGFMGVARVGPGERIAEHYHPYSEEFLYVTRGAVTVDLDDEPVPLGAGEALYIAVNTRHRVRNPGDEEAEIVFHLGPLAPRPELGHVDTESAEGETASARSERVPQSRSESDADPLATRPAVAT